MLAALRSTALGSGSLAVAVLASAAIYGRSVTKSSPPPDSLLTKRVKESTLLVEADCYSLEIDGKVSLEEFVEAFFTSQVFQVERMVLPVASTDEQARQFARGTTADFATWRAVGRTEGEFLTIWGDGSPETTEIPKSGTQGATWFRVEPAGTADAPRTRISLGSSIVGTPNPLTSFVMGIATPLHGVYSQTLVQCAADNLQSRV
jgi:hypothetical protein